MAPLVRINAHPTVTRPGRQVREVSLGWGRRRPCRIQVGRRHADVAIMSGFAMDRRPTGKNMLAAAWALLRSNPTLMMLPVLSAACTVLATLLVAVPGFLITLPGKESQLSSAAYVALLVVS